jgi:LAO/AO transport system ATPase
VARAISLVESANPLLREMAAELATNTGRSHVLGVTGAPGVGKSTTITALVRALRARGLRVGVLAVDPSSPFSGGAVLGDRVRMGGHADDRNVFIRSMAARGHLGGLAWGTPQALRVLDAAGFDVVLIETVGVGQSELDVAFLVDTTLALVAPGMGDGIQAAKAGILEVADVLVINKADHQGVGKTENELRAVQTFVGRQSEGGEWCPPICRTVASREADNGIDGLLDHIHRHRQWLTASGEGLRRRTARAAQEIEAITLAEVRGRMGDVQGSAAMEVLAGRVVAGALDPFRAADLLLEQLP